MDWVDVIASCTELVSERKGKFHPRASSRIVGNGTNAFVELTKGMWAKIDLADVELVSDKPWNVEVGKCGLHYARTNGGYLKMHQAIMSAPKGMQIDHINGNGLDNTRSNMRVVTPGQNQMNKSRQKNSPYGTGVSRDKRYGTYVAHIKVGKQKYLGSFKTAEAAQEAYKIAARESFGEHSYFSRANQIEKGKS